jgi:putative endonuclease
MAEYKLQSSLGILGEKIAVRYLRGKGYRILDTNYYHQAGPRTGEIDIVAQKGDKLSFIEVKTRLRERNRPALLPEEQVTRAKLRKLDKTAQRYLREKRKEGLDYSFHVVTVCYNPESQFAEIRHLEDVFF